MYIECEPQDNPEDYLTFTSQNGEEEGEGGPQEMYEAMANTDEPLDLYEDPVQGVISPSGEVSPIPQQPPLPGPKNDDRPQDVYEEPITSPPPPTIPTPTPPPSAENSGSGAVYARTQIIAGAPPTNDTATEWIYDTTKKDEKKLKPSQLENVLCKGNLEKLGGKNKKTWQVRFCALAGPFMYFYEKESSKTYRNRIVLPMYTVAEAPEHTNAKKRHFAFKLTHTDQGGMKKDYFFRSSKRESCETWVQAMRSLNERTTITPQHVLVTTSTAEGGASGADVQQEMYEPIDPMTMSDEEVEEGEDDPEDYVDVVPPPLEDQEEYVDVPPPTVEDDDQENYDDMADLRSPLPPPIPPPPSKTPAPSVTRRQPDSPVDTSKVYSQYPNGINLQNVFVALWDFSSSARDELSVQRGDLVHVVDPNPKVQWWASEALDQNAASKTGLYGFLPSNYVEAAFELV
ncbi:Src kinase-associated phosphoprotein 2 [Geodia barretti]|nr:Src kinase-associated phosphoprotein 2 [Geodia barretti]